MNTLENVDLGLANYWKVTCLDKDGNIKWEENEKNIIVTAGLNHVLDVEFHAVTQVTAWYIGLKASGTPIAADTMSSHSSWAELTGYAGNRKEWTEGAASSGSMTNSSSVDFAVNATATVAGAFLNTAATGTSGTLYGVVDFSSARAVINGDTLQVTVTVTAASA
jgi:hypothetical protein